MTAADRLDQIEARIKAAGDEGWRRYPDGTYSNDGYRDLITHAPTDLAALTAALRAVRALHKPVRLGCVQHYGRTDCGCPPRHSCNMCRTAEHPCPTVRAIETKLEVKE